MTPASTRILVATPTLGRSAFLDRMVASVASQPLDILHVLAAPAEAVAELRSRYPRTRVVPDAGSSGGLYGALNAALAAVPSGWDWFTYINDDDALLPGFSQMFLHHRERRCFGKVVYGDVELVDEANRRVSRVTVESDPARFPALLRQGISPLTQQGMLFHRVVVRSLGGFDTRYRLCADLDFWLRAYAFSWDFRYYPIRVAQFRLRGGQLSGDTATTVRESAEIVRRHLPGFPRPGELWRARLHFRIANLPRYLARVRARGWRRSYELLQQGSPPP